MIEISTEDLIFLDNILDKEAFLSFIKVNGGIIKNSYNDLEDALSYYKSIYKKILSQKKLNLNLNKFYYQSSYTYNIYNDPFDFIFNAFYNIIWNTEKISIVVNKYKIEPETLDLSSIYQTMTFSATKNINFEHLPTALKNDSPICIIKFEPFSFRNLIQLNSSCKDMIILDGNHRVYSRVKYNEKKGINLFRKKFRNIMAYKLSPEQHMELMPHHYIKILYKINSNFNYIRKYIIGEISLAELRLSLYKL